MRPARDRSPAQALADARDLPDGPARAAALERVARQADARSDLRCGVEARLALVEAYLHLGERWRLADPVRRCRDALDRAPHLLDAHPTEAETLRRYQGYAVEAVFGTPRAGLEQARSLLADLANRGDPDGELVAQLRCRLADHLGDEPTARHEYARWRAAVPDPAAGCPACALVRQAELLAGWGDTRGALETLAPVLDGDVDCTDQPERALAVAQLPWLRLGEPERAARAHVRAYRRHRREPTGLPYLASHLRFCALGGHLDRGLDILAEQLPRLAGCPDDLAAMEFAAAGALLCGLAVAAGRGDRRFHRPGPGGRRGAEADVAALGAELLARAHRLAGSFDARNGTGHQSGRVASWLAEGPLAAPVPLPPDDDDPAATDDPEDDGGPVPLRVPVIAAALAGRGDGYTVEGDTVTGRWGGAVIRFRPAGEGGDILHARVVADRRLPTGRLAEAYAFCNAWNHDRLMPKAYVHQRDGELVLAGDVTVDLAHGVAPAQLTVLVTATVNTGVAYAEAVAALP
ncbi:Putative sensory transduction regulator [Micromonospora mirobrigensis]|uniref:Putative sensory transduction regulator n=1 Tax=Micromonospora mirobrigensis TaxID=262898 RepID=A0A1C5A4Q6_9ACTN|nr:YbjN domain-containing protein [Micromonospora mirobrigensis]SCF40178.1 Putative sensory transduction regulator [Micromonospora mirobrigensis]